MWLQGLLFFMQDHSETDRLINQFDITLANDFAHQIVYFKFDLNNPAVCAFRNWLPELIDNEVVGLS